MSKEFNICALEGTRDWKAFRDLRLEALRLYPESFGSSFGKEAHYQQPKWIETLDNPQNRYFGIFHGKSLIGLNGVVTLENDPNSALMIAWYLRDAFQGKGLFSELVKAGIDWAESEPRFERICVDHRDGNDSSRRVNQRHGFTYIGREPWEWPDGVTSDLVMYERRFER